MGCWQLPSPSAEFQDTKRTCLKKTKVDGGWRLVAEFDFWPPCTLTYSCTPPHTPQHTPGHAYKRRVWLPEMLLNHLFSYSKNVFIWRHLKTHCLGQSSHDRLLHFMIRRADEPHIATSVAYVVSFYILRTWTIVNMQATWATQSVKFEESGCCLKL